MFTIHGLNHFSIQEWESLQISTAMEVTDHVNIGRLYISRTGLYRFHDSQREQVVDLDTDHLVLISGGVHHVIEAANQHSLHTGPLNGSNGSPRPSDLIVVRFRMFDSQSNATQTPSIDRIPMDSITMVNIREMLLEEFGNGTPGSDALCLSAFQLLIVHSLRTIGVYDRLAHCNNQLLANVDPRLTTVTAEIRSDPAMDWSVAKMARRACMSRSAFAALFRESVGQSPFEYVTTVRMERASRLLQETTLSVQQIAHRVGYESESAFSTAYKRRTGQSPTEHRQTFAIPAATFHAAAGTQHAYHSPAKTNHSDFLV